MLSSLLLSACATPCCNPCERLLRDSYARGQQQGATHAGGGGDQGATYTGCSEQPMGSSAHGLHQEAAHIGSNGTEPRGNNKGHLSACTAPSRYLCVLIPLLARVCSSVWLSAAALR